VRLAAIIPATDRPETLAACVAAIRAADAPPEDVTVVTEPRGAGPAEARNRGAASAHGDVLVFIDADVVVHEDVFARIRARLASGRLDAVFGSYDAEPAAPQLVSRFRNLLHHHVHQESGGPVASFWAGLGAVRREAFEAVGGFDAERYPAPAIEDVELGGRLAEAGYPIELDPTILGTHLKRWTIVEMLRTDALARGAPWVELALARRSLARSLNLGWRHRLSAGASLVVVAAAARRRPATSVAAVGALVVLNRRFYGLLLRELGPVRATAAVGLHALHHLAGLAGIPVGIAAHVRNRRGRRR
jgi:hypothetical protein